MAPSLSLGSGPLHSSSESSSLAPLGSAASHLSLKKSLSARSEPTCRRSSTASALTLPRSRCSLTSSACEAPSISSTRAPGVGTGGADFLLLLPLLLCGVLSWAEHRSGVLAPPVSSPDANRTGDCATGRAGHRCGCVCARVEVGSPPCGARASTVRAGAAGVKERREDDAAAPSFANRLSK